MTSSWRRRTWRTWRTSARRGAAARGCSSYVPRGLPQRNRAGDDAPNGGSYVGIGGVAVELASRQAGARSPAHGVVGRVLCGAAARGCSSYVPRGLPQRNRAGDDAPNGGSYVGIGGVAVELASRQAGARSPAHGVVGRVLCGAAARGCSPHRLRWPTRCERAVNDASYGGGRSGCGGVLAERALGKPPSVVPNRPFPGRVVPPQ